MKVEDILKLKEAGFTVDEIVKLDHSESHQESTDEETHQESPDEESQARQPPETDVWEEINQTIYHK